MEHILGKITAHGDERTGPDVLLDLVVEREWLRDARTIDIELPRHMCCAACQGGGCGVCGHSGALTLRGRAELAVVVRVPLQQRDPDAATAPDSTRVVTLKVPGYGGLPDDASGAASRGSLLIRITTSGPVSSCIRAVPPLAGSAAELRAEPSAAHGPLASVRSQLETMPAPAETPGTGADAPRVSDALSTTTRSVSPPPEPRAMRSSKSEAASKPRSAKVEPSIGWTWKDTLIGFLVLVLGALAAWLFISPR